MSARALVCALALACGACGGAQKPACSPESKAAVKELYAAAARDVISSGSCDKVQRVETCSAYMAVEANYVAALKVCQ